ncbi:helix-turn-helix transcriptional regulator [Methylocella sp. CPCC 101449]|uniref:helix-turn-helix domain-containing protein n=1 Tax=Methylocella sp. CPCC 101449 TaxID=2987531 RepID=UPI002891D8E8|nr:helix-turn-helix transcriptional regulator [Methylocella sp. CPCC 101449]MDT2020406.1 helix-turn-helix domain-containing protein [Methylocella sp. CPCC 101449]
MAKVPNPIDKHVGSRVRLRRVLLGLSQEKLGDALGLTFQQVQKYEKGANRIGASRLQEISKILDVPPSYFFEGAPAGSAEAHVDAGEVVSSALVTDFIATAEGIQLNKAFVRIKSQQVRKRIIDLVVSLASETGADETDRDARDESESGNPPKS